MWSLCCTRDLVPAPIHHQHNRPIVALLVPFAIDFSFRSRARARIVVARSSMSGSSSEFSKRMETAWLISQQPRPIACSSCGTNGHVDCEWCGGTGFFILGNSMLCEVPSRNTACIICAGKGVAFCSDCKGTGFRAKWLVDSPPPQ